MLDANSLDFRFNFSTHRDRANAQMVYMGRKLAPRIIHFILRVRSIGLIPEKECEGLRLKITFTKILMLSESNKIYSIVSRQNFVEKSSCF